MCLRSRIVCCGTFLVLAATGAAHATDVVTITAAMPGPDQGSYRLAGQSAFIVVQSAGSTSGGQLDGVESPGAVITYTEVFPPPSIGDYLTFGYFGLVETLDAGGDLTDRSLVMALRSGVGVGQTIGDLFPGLDEDALVAAFQTNDSPEFLSLLDAVGSSAFAQGAIELPTIGRPGELLTLVSFTGGAGGHDGVAIGTLANTTVPGPLSAGVLGAATVAWAGRRRR